MQIIKRDGSYQEYSSQKIIDAIKKAFSSEEKTISENELKDIIFSIENEIDFRLERNEAITVEWIQDRVEIELMKREHFKEVRSYILYRETHAKTREAINGIVEITGDKNLIPVLRKIKDDFKENVYDLNILLSKFKLLAHDGMSKENALNTLIAACEDLISKEAPKYDYIASRFLKYQLDQEISFKEKNLGINSFYDKLTFLTLDNLYGNYLLDKYDASQIEELGNYIDDKRDELLTYGALKIIIKQYLLQSEEYGVIERPQEMFMTISMHLAINEKDKMYWAKRFYDTLSSLKLVLSSSTMMNARTTTPEMLSSYIDTVPSNITGIYKTLENYSENSKINGGYSFYFGKVKAFENGSLKWIRLINETTNAFKEYGDKSKACACYLDVWHKDLPELLNYKINNKEDFKYILPAVCFPDLFWKMAKENINDNWYLMCPEEIKEVKGYSLEDYYGDEWLKRYKECVEDENISKRIMSVKELVRLILKTIIETGTPFIFNRDAVNIANPNKHKGIIYCSNLCTEINQITSCSNYLDQEIIKDKDGNIVVVEKYKAGNYVASNLGSLNLGVINIKDNVELKNTIDTAIRALDNVIDINEYSIPYTYIYNKEYRPIALGALGYHHCLTKQGIEFESDNHLKFADELFEKINFFAINASSSLAKEKGKYRYFDGSDYDNGNYFKLRNYSDEKWLKLIEKVNQNGLRNAYLLAISPNSITSIVAGTTRGIEPIFNKFYSEERSGNTIKRIAPELSQDTYWLYKNAYDLDQKWILKACGARQRHIDQSQAITLYISKDYTYRDLLGLLIMASESGVKTIHYIRSKTK